MSFFRWDGPVFTFIGRVVDYLILTILCIVCSIPIVTAGAAITAKYYVSMKIVRGEEPEIIRPFFRAFKDNFRQATILWLIQMAVLGILGGDLYLLHNMEHSKFNTIVGAMVLIAFVLAVMTTMAMFPLLARFEFTIRHALFNSVVFVMGHLLKMLYLVALIALSIVAIYHYLNWLPLIWSVMSVIQLSLSSRMYVKEFKKVIDKKVERGEYEDPDKKEDEEKEPL